MAGACRNQVTCKGNKWEHDGVTRCHCKGVLPAGSNNFDCFRCYQRKTPFPVSKQQTIYTESVFTFEGLHQHCTSCRNSKLYHKGKCLNEKDVCPVGLTKYTAGSYKNACLEPFVCRLGKRVRGPDETPDGRACRCTEKACFKCSWDVDGTKCLECKYHQFLLHGKCVGARKCIEMGGLPTLPQVGTPWAVAGRGNMCT